MSHDARVLTFVPSAIEPARAKASETSHAAGFAAGWAAGARAAEEAAAAERDRLRIEHEAAESTRAGQVADALRALAAAAALLDARRAPVLVEAEASLHHAALALAQAILAREVRPGPDSARALLDRALALPPEVEPTTLRVHPDDLREIQAVLDAGLATIPAGLVLVADPRLDQGDAIAEHADGALDARIGRALDRARAVLEERP